MKKFYIISLLVLISVRQISATIVSQGPLDGTTTPTIVDKWVPSTNGDLAQGYVQIREGIFLQSTNLNGIDINNRADGVINLGGGGTLQLIKDLTFGGTSFGVNDGIITTTDADQQLILQRDQVIATHSYITVSGNLIINSHNNAIDLQPSSTLAIRAGNKLTLKNTSLLNISDTKLVMENSTSKLILDNCDLVLNGNYTFSQGSLEIKGACSINTTSSLDTVFTFSGHFLLINTNSSLRIGQRVIFKYSPGSGIREGIKLNDTSSQLILDNSKLVNANSIGMILHNGSLVIEGTSIIDGTSTNTKQALILGGAPDAWGDCRLTIQPQAKLTIKQSGIVYRNKGANGFNNSGGSGLLDISSDGRFTIEESLAPLEALAITSTNAGAAIFLGNSSINLGNKKLSFGLIQLSTDAGVGSIDPGGSSALITFSNQDGQSPEYARFSSNGLYYAIGMNGANTISYPQSKLQIYSLTESGSFASIVSRLAQDIPNSTEGPTANRIFSLGFSPDGKAFASSESSQINVYQFDTNNGPASQDLSPISSMATAGLIFSMAWSPDGRHLAVCEAGGSMIVYNWNGEVLRQVATTTAVSADARGICWSPNGKYIVVADTSTISRLLIFRFENERLLKFVTSRSIAGSTLATDLDISPDGHYILVGHEESDAGNGGTIYSFFDGILSNNLIAGTGTGFGLSCKWSPEGDLIAIGEISDFRILSFNGSSVTSLVSTSMAAQVSGLDWHPTTSYLGITHFSDGSTSGEIQTRTIPRLIPQQVLNLQNGTVTTDQKLILNNMNLRVGA